MKSFLIALFVFNCLLAIAQAPQEMNYQTVVRDNAGNPVTNTPVTLRFIIHDGSIAGNAEYTEIQSTTSNQFGLANVQIGSVTSLSGVNWSSTTKWLEVDVNINGGGYITAGTSQLISVPYALYAANSGGGSIGATGAMGATGLTGITGATGVQGSIGATGVTGAIGVTGATGVIGITGATGNAWSDYAIFDERVSSGNYPLTALFSNTWNNRLLNYTENQVGSSITLSTDTILLQPGTYYISAYSSFGDSIYDSLAVIANGTLNSKLRLKNISNASTLLLSAGKHLQLYINEQGSYTTQYATHDAYILQLEGVITISETSKILLQHYIDFNSQPWPTVHIDAGIPLNIGEDEVYAHILIEKIN